MPPALFTRSAHHSVPRSPAAPTGAAMPARMAMTPIFTSGACARATSGKPPIVLTAVTAPAPFRNPRLLVFTIVLLAEMYDLAVVIDLLGTAPNELLKLGLVSEFSKIGIDRSVPL